MKKNPHRIGIIFWAAMLLAAIPAFTAPPAIAGDNTRKGVLELECNIAKVDLCLCPRDQFMRETKEKFFGLLKYHEDTCSGEQVFLGTTPLKPRTVPAGRYVVLVPPDYAWEREGPVEINIQPDERFFFLLKLFSREDKSSGAGPGDSTGAGGLGVGTGGLGVGTGGGGSGSGGVVGTPPP